MHRTDQQKILLKNRQVIKKIFGKKHGPQKWVFKNTPHVPFLHVRFQNSSELKKKHAKKKGYKKGTWGV